MKEMATHSSTCAWKIPWMAEPGRLQSMELQRVTVIEHRSPEFTQSCPTLCDPMDCTACQALLSMGFSRQGYWSGLPFPSPRDLPNPGIKPGSSALQVDALPSELLGKADVKVDVISNK